MLWAMRTLRKHEHETHLRAAHEGRVSTAAWSSCVSADFENGFEKDLGINSNRPVCKAKGSAQSVAPSPGGSLPLLAAVTCFLEP
eukprot:1160395-Pelagomonas_calceolata.AAC.4